MEEGKIDIEMMKRNETTKRKGVKVSMKVCDNHEGIQPNIVRDIHLVETYESCCNLRLDKPLKTNCKT